MARDVLGTGDPERVAEFKELLLELENLKAEIQDRARLCNACRSIAAEKRIRLGTGDRIYGRDGRFFYCSDFAYSGRH